MIIGILKETYQNETRVAASPQSVSKLKQSEFEIIIEKNAGLSSGFTDDDYKKSGATVLPEADKIYKQADILFCLHVPEAAKIKHLKSGSTIIGDFQSAPKETLSLLQKQKITCFALEKLPRITRAQPFDILSSQNNLSGYRAVIEAVRLSIKAAPMMITSAGTIPPLKVLIIGIGVAGLQAIATAKRLGAKVFAADPREETKEQAKSLGATFVENINDILPQTDIVITSAFAAGKSAPLIITGPMLKQLPRNAVLIDMAAASGGNIQGTKDGQTIYQNGRIICGNSNLSALIPASASLLLGNNFADFLLYIYSAKDKKFLADFNDSLIKETCIIKG